MKKIYGYEQGNGYCMVGEMADDIDSPELVSNDKKEGKKKISNKGTTKKQKKVCPVCGENPCICDDDVKDDKVVKGEGGSACGSKKKKK